MGCASSAARADEQASASVKKQEPTTSKDQVELKSTGPSLQETAFALGLTKLINEAASGAKPKDAWVILYKCTDLICSTFGIKTCSIVLYTSTGLSCKLTCNSGSVLNELVLQHPDLLPAETLGFTTSATANQETVCVKAGDELWDSLCRESYADFHLLTGSRGACTALAVLPLCGGPKCPGALLLGHTDQLAWTLQQSWLTMLAPLLGLYVSETCLVRKLSIVEKLVDAASLSALAYAVTTDLGEIFEWCHREDVEARLVVLGQEAETATVYCKVPVTALVDDRNSMRSGLSSSLARSGPNALLEDGLVGTHMCLDNTLTKRCLNGRQRLLFVADVMQALKLYGEPWKDIFFDNAVVLAPSWVLAAPLILEGKKLGAVLWLSSCRVNSDVLMRTASTCASPIIHAITRAVAMHQLYAAAGSGPVAMVGGGLLGDSAYSKGTLVGGGGPFTSQHGVSSFTALSSRQSSTLSRGRTQRLGTGTPEEGLAGRGSNDHDMIVGDLDVGGSRPGVAVPDIPVKYILRHSPSTSALMRMYKSTIAQRAPAVDEDRITGSIHEIRILSKAGEGAFGSVYVGRWRNIVVAVKIIKDTCGTRSLKTAWELAVNKSLSHPSIVTVHAILTDVHLQRTSTRILRFVPSTLESQQVAAAAASTGPGSPSQTAFAFAPSPRLSNPDGGAGNGSVTPRSHTGTGSTSAGGGAAAPAAPVLPPLATTPSCPLPGKDSAPEALATLGGGAITVAAAAAAAAAATAGGTGGLEHSALPGNAAPVSPPPVFGRTSAGSTGGLPSVALLKPTKPLAPKVHVGRKPLYVNFDERKLRVGLQGVLGKGRLLHPSPKAALPPPPPAPAFRSGCCFLLMLADDREAPFPTPTPTTRPPPPTHTSTHIHTHTHTYTHIHTRVLEDGCCL
ncbi:hypothetical protein Vretifemale_20444 [Volvox reticuliferus]|uniref:Serine-threonine/tyrosine-protein kinase catalytic domain-containing protein n=1 Tax=Volvox reticuliferus TaxID=1737510 RepID=A0A8J4D4Y4_9CHLO|nr:hypothetical protein Vretifemale_20444 [Volvox reticuliferus]